MNIQQIKTRSVSASFAFAVALMFEGYIIVFTLPVYCLITLYSLLQPYGDAQTLVGLSLHRVKGGAE